MWHPHKYAGTHGAQAPRRSAGGTHGGYVIIKHTLDAVKLYSFFGHLNSDHLLAIGQQVKAGEIIGRIGKEEDSGGWFTHGHFHILTQKAIDQDLLLTGYVAESTLPRIDKLFPSPYSLFRY